MTAPLDAGEAAARLRGVALFCATMVMFTLLDSAAKYATAYLPALEIVWVRFASQTVLVVLVLRPWRDWAPYRTDRWPAQIIRSVFLFLSTVFNFLALRTLRLDQTTTIMFSTAFFVAAAAGPLLGEWVGPRRWAAIAVSFVSVLDIVRPGTDAFQPAMLLSLAATLSYAGYILMTRKLAATDSTVGLLLISGAVPTVLLAPVSLPTAIWPPSLLVGAALVATGFCGAVGHYMLIHAHRLAPTSVLSPFLYTQLVWMTAAGYVFFGQAPDGVTLLGSAIIVASGLYILYRQRIHGDS